MPPLVFRKMTGPQTFTMYIWMDATLAWYGRQKQDGMQADLVLPIRR